MKNTKNHPKKLIYLAIFSFALIMIGLVLGLLFSEFGFNKQYNNSNNFSSEAINNDYKKINELSTKDFTEVNVSLSNQFLIFYTNCDGISMEISPEQAISVATSLDNKTFPRPLTSDLLSQVITHFNIDIISVKITEAKDEIYYAEIILKNENKILSLDTRPSDAVALAIKHHKPIFVKKDILSKYSHNICQ